MKSSRSKRHARALGAAMAGILAGSTLAVAQGAHASTHVTKMLKKQVVAAEEGDEPNGCNGPDGCSGEGKDDSKEGS